ncbi:MAG: L17 family ribosomal protein, partial [Candidatus Pacebacteria bacterium]|nr:L17 family ribosomal protein [Candidatus Paceibacterota bacterium]
LHSRRILHESFDKKVVKKIIEDVAPRYKEKSGGYARVIKLGQRKSDGAKMANLELIKNK